MGLISTSNLSIAASLKPISPIAGVIVPLTLAKASTAAPMTLSIAPTSVSGTISGSGSVTTNAATVTAAGSSGSLFYSWSAPAGITVNSPSAASTTFTASLNQGSSVSGTASCLVQDVITGQQQTITVNVTLRAVNSNPFTCGMSPSNVGPAGGPNTAQSVTLTATPNNGSGNFSYSWGVQHSNMSCSISPNGATCGVNYYMGPADTHGYTSAVGVTVTDLDTGSSASASCLILQWANGQYGYPSI